MEVVIGCEGAGKFSPLGKVSTLDDVEDMEIVR